MNKVQSRIAAERKMFEEWASAPPYECELARWPNSERTAWPGQYREERMQLAWEAWCAALGITEGING